MVNVLLLSDFSAVAINATHYAMNFLRDKQVHFYLLNIYRPLPDSEENSKALKVKTLTTLEERIDKLGRRFNNPLHKISGHYSEDTLVSAARKFVAEHKIDLIVMGSVGRQFENATILGDHTFEIMSKIKCNILAVPEDTGFFFPKKMLMPLDYATSFNSSNLQFLNKSGLFKKAHLSVKELTDSDEFQQGQNMPGKDVFKGIKDIEIEFSTLDREALEDVDTWQNAQNKYDLIVLMAKNIRICDKLLHNKYGIFTSVPNRLPILMLHD